LNFKYKAVNSKGKKATGEIIADDKSAAIFLLKNKGLIPTDIKAISKNTKGNAVSVTGKNNGKVNRTLSEIEIFEKDIHDVKINKKKILGVLNQFAIMMKAGVSLSLCMEVLVDQEKDKKLKKILEEIRDDMYSGYTLSSSLKKFKAFNEITINIISAGEVNGRLDMAFERAAQILENEVNLTAKVKGAVTYPAFLLSLTIVVVIILNAIVLPVFTDMFDRMGAEVPALTRFVMASSHILTSFWYLFVIGIAAIIIFYAYGRKNSESFKQKTDYYKLRIPIIGKLLHKLYIARFCRIMASLVDAGVEIVHALTVSANVIPNTYVKKYLYKVLEDVKVGVPINLSMNQYPVFESLLVSMVRVGEESGMLYDVLDKMADLYESQTENQTKQLTSLMEPAMTIIIAIVVGTVVISVVMPMFGQYDLLM